MSLTRFYRLLGPGILFAAAAIGVSHLVQSTRAGALHGLALIPILLLACIAKYPSLVIGVLYPMKTGRTLLQSYRDQGLWALTLYLLIALYSMWFVLAAIALTTAGLVQAVLGWQAGIETATAAVLGAAVLVLVSGRYQGLEHVSKWLLGVLAMLLPLATLLVLPQVDFSASAWVVDRWDYATIAFVIALAGWMPIPVDASVMTSTWSATRSEESGNATSAADARADFNVGYGLTILFALCFVLLGAGVLHASGTEPPAGAGPFAGMVIELFTSQLGAWSFYLIGAIAFVTMFTTLLTAMDGQVRVVLYAARSLRPGWSPGTGLYPVMLVAYASGGLGVVTFFLEDFATFIDFATSLGFLIAPVVVILNHLALFGRNGAGGSRGLYWWSLGGGAVLCGASLVYFGLAVFRF